MPNRKNILIVDKDSAFLHALKNEFVDRAELYQIAFATQSAQAMKIMEKFLVHVLAVNVNLHGESGIDLLAWARGAHPDIYVVLFTETEVNEEYKHTLLYGGAAAVLQKPFHADELVRIADKLCPDKTASSAVIDFVKLLDLLQMIAADHGSVRMEVKDQGARQTGLITVQDGYLVTAVTTNGRTGMDALVQMLAWKEPAITANKLPSQAGAPTFGMPLEQALLQAVVKLDETGA